jgi:hypothetical protein
MYQNDLYMGGSFTDQNGNPSPKIARWDGEQWLDIGGGINSPGVNGCSVADMAVFNDELYAVGSCAYAGGVPAQYIAKWDGFEWCGLGDVFDNTITAIEVHNGELYIGGGFQTINGDTILRVAKWIGGDLEAECGRLNGVEEPANGTFIIYPNPTSTTLTITSQKPITSIQLTDLFGRVVLAQQGQRGKTEMVDVSMLAPSVYFVAVEADGAQVVKKVVVQ